MPKIPNMNLPREATPWGNSVEQRLTELTGSAFRREQGEGNTNKSQSATIRVLQEQVAGLNVLFNNLVQQVNDAINANSMTTTEIQAAIASPGAITPTDVTASGAVYSAGVVRSPGSKAFTAVVGYSNMYIDVDGNMAGNTSSRRYKQDITPVQTDYPGFLGLTTYKFRYKQAVEQIGDDAAWEYGLIAEEVVKVAPWACFFEEDGETVRGVNYDRLVVALLNVVQDHERRLKALEA